VALLILVGGVLAVIFGAAALSVVLDWYR